MNLEDSESQAPRRGPGATGDHYAVIGNPVAHSLSPRIHALFAEQTDQAMRYVALHAPKDGFEAAVADFQNEGGRGLNVTLPFKRDAFEFAEEYSARAARAGAVNTLVLRGDGGRYGDNTDGIGLVRDLTDNHGMHVRGRNLLILGAGGAVRGILEPLLAESPQRIVIANRTVERAEALCRDFGDLGTLAARGFEELEGERFDLVIHATAAGLHGELPPLPDTLFASGGEGYDLSYSIHEVTPFLYWARQHGAHRAVDGLGMLVEQAAESFFLWRGLRPQTCPIIEHLRRPE